MLQFFEHISMEQWNWQVASDLHLEFYDKHDKGRITPEVFMKPRLAPNLALCGDIGQPTRPAYRAFIDWCAQNYEATYVVSGNHEYYTLATKEAKIEKEIDDVIRSVCARHSNVFFLQKDAIQTPKGRILGCTLWTYIAPQNRFAAQQTMNDYTMIPNWSVDYQRRRHAEHVSWLSDQIHQAEEYNEPTVVLTHHLPTFNLIHSEFKESTTNYNFASALDHLIRPPVTAWFCGHTHRQVELLQNGTYLLANPFGYPNENKTTDVRTKWVMCTVSPRLGPVPPLVPKPSPLLTTQNDGALGGRPKSDSPEDFDFV